MRAVRLRVGASQMGAQEPETVCPAIRVQHEGHVVRDKPVAGRDQQPERRPPDEVVQRAESRLGESGRHVHG